MTKHSIDPRDTDGGITAAAIEKETETPDYWRECAKGLHATVVKLQDAEEVLRARTEKAERERDEYRRSLERWRESAIRGRKERDEAKKFAGLWKEATRRTIRHAERKDEALDAWRTRALDAEERERILIAERARRGEVCPDKDAHWRLDEALEDCDRWRIEAQEAANDILHWRRQLDKAGETIADLRGRLAYPSDHAEEEPTDAEQTNG